MMKVVALFQIYLPYFLPRTPEWSEGKNFQFHFDVEGHLVNVHPRRIDEKLFPTSIDENLSQANLKLEYEIVVPIDAPTEIFMGDRYLDRIEVQVYGEVATPDECASSEVAFAYRRLAIGGCNAFLRHCRLVSRDPDIEGLTWYYNFEDGRCYFATPHTLIWFDADSRESLRNTEGKELWAVSAGSVRSPIRLPVDFDLVKGRFLSNKPDLSVSLLVSAKEHLIKERLHEGIINLASACEVAYQHYEQRKGMSKDPKVKTILDPKKTTGSFAERRYHLVTMHIDKRSLRMDDANAFDLLEKAYLTCNKLVHSGDLAYKDAKSQTMVTVKRSLSIEFFQACERAVDWIGQL